MHNSQVAMSFSKNHDLVTQNNAVVTFLFLLNNQNHKTEHDMHLGIDRECACDMERHVCHPPQLSRNVSESASLPTLRTSLFLVKRNIIKLLAIKVCGLF